MPTVPIERNQAGIAGVTNEKLRAGDYGGTGLQALGAGLRTLGPAMQDLADHLPRPAPPPDNSEALYRNAAVKAAWNHYGERARAIKQEFQALKGFAAGAALGQAAGELSAAHKEALALLPDTALRAQADLSIGARHEADLAGMETGVNTQIGVAQRDESDRAIAGAGEDALDHLHDPVLFDKFVETGAETIAAQGALAGRNATDIAGAQRAYRSGVNRNAVDRQVVDDPFGAMRHLRDYWPDMEPEDRLAASATIYAPLAELQAVADLDSRVLAQAPTAPVTPAFDSLEDLTARMHLLTPEDAPPAPPPPAPAPGTLPAGGASGTGTGVGAGPATPGTDAPSTPSTPATDPSATATGGAGAPAAPGAESSLAALVRRYGGDAAMAWAASRLGVAAVDAAVAAKGDAWFGAIPADARAFVAGNMAMLGASGSARQAPVGADRMAAAEWITAQPEWNDARKQLAFDELNRRIGLEDQGRAAIAAAATDTGFAIADRLGAGFLSITQIPPGVRRDLPDATLAALTRRAALNANPVRVDPNGATAQALNLMAAQDPRDFAALDLRLAKDELAPDEYAALVDAQKGLSGFPPSPRAMTQRRGLELLRLFGMAGDAAGGEGMLRPQTVSVSSIGLASEGDQSSTGQYGRPKFKQAETTDLPIVDWIRETLGFPVERRNASRPKYKQPAAALNYLNPAEDADGIVAVNKMRNPPGFFMIYSHGSASGTITDKSHGAQGQYRTAGQIYNELMRAGYREGTPIIISSCFAANGKDAKKLSALTHGIVYAAKAYVTVPSDAHQRYGLMVYTDGYESGELSGYAKFNNGKEEPSDFLGVRYDPQNDRWSVIKKKGQPSPVGDRIVPKPEDWWTHFSRHL